LTKRLTPKPPTSGVEAWPSLSPEATEAWLSRYRCLSRLYAWGWHCALLPVVFAIIWMDIGELHGDVFWAWRLFAAVTCVMPLLRRGLWLAVLLGGGPTVAGMAMLQATASPLRLRIETAAGGRESPCHAQHAGIACAAR